MLGSDSDIAKGLAPLLEADGWIIEGWQRGLTWPVGERWDLAIVALGRVAPVGHWTQADDSDWDRTMDANVLLPIRLLRHIWARRNPGASVCCLAGSNPNMIMPGYSSYNISKMALLKAVEQIDAESPDAKIFALGPGIVLTKIHEPTLVAGWHNPKLVLAMHEKRSVPFPLIYQCLRWCIDQPKDVIGGRNLCVSDAWDRTYLSKWLESNPNLFKLRRQQ